MYGQENRWTCTDTRWEIIYDLTLLRYNLSKGKTEIDAVRLAMHCRRNEGEGTHVCEHVIEKEGSVNSVGFMVHRFYDVKRRMGKIVLTKGVTDNAG